MTTKRCTPAERRVFSKPFQFPSASGRPIRGTEPALGSLDQRLGILVRRFGGSTRLAPSGENVWDYLDEWE